ncbi:MAG: O-antigen ligase family protein [Bacteroidia bacterium]|nr:O-antigen ligase family protein [Bacteroidia bacterium]
MIEIAFFLTVMGIVVYGCFRRPGLYLAYILFFQNLNNMFFEEMGLEIFRYSTTALLFPALIVLHYGKKDFGKITSQNFKNGISIGFVLLLIYMGFYALLVGENHEISFLMSFIFPVAILFMIAAVFSFNVPVYKDIFFGVLIFGLLTFVFISLFNISGVQDYYAERGVVGQETGMSVITQGRMAGLMVLMAFLGIFYSNIIGRIILVGFLIVGLYWLFLSGSKGPLVSMLSTILLYLFYRGQKKSVLKWTLYVIGILLIIVINFDIGNLPLYERIASILEPNKIRSIQRYYRWIVFFEYLPSHFITGLGPGGWGKHIWNSLESYPHNIIIEFVLDYGIVGFVSLLLMSGIGYITLINLLKEDKSYKYLQVIACGWVYYFINTMFSGGIIDGNQPFFAFTGIMVGLSIFTKRSDRSKDEKGIPPYMYKTIYKYK